MTAYILLPSCFCETWAICVSWITYNHSYYAPCLACWVLFGYLAPAMCNRISCAQVHELAQSHCGDNQEGTLYSWLHIYYTHLASVRFEPSVCHRSLMTTYIMIFALLVEHSLVNWYQQCITVHHVPKCISCDKAIVVITRRAHCYHGCIYITPTCFCRFWTLCVSWITYNHLYYAPCFACWVHFGSLVPAMCNRTSCAQVHELQQSHCGDNREGTLSS